MKTDLRLSLDFDHPAESLSQVSQGKRVLSIKPETISSLSTLYRYLWKDQQPYSFTLAAQNISKADSFQALIGDMLPSVVKITGRGRQGTGFIAGNDGVIFTNRHVVGSTNKVEVAYFDGATRQGNVIYKGYQADFAVIQVDNPPRRAPRKIAAPLSWQSLLAHPNPCHNWLCHHGRAFCVGGLADFSWCPESMLYLCVTINILVLVKVLQF